MPFFDPPEHKMIDDLQRLTELEEQRVEMQFKISRLLDLVGGFRAELKEIVREESQLLAAIDRPSSAEAGSQPGDLTRSERAVLFFLTEEELSNKEIAGRLHISERTVKFHVSNIYRKMGLPEQQASGGYRGGNTSYSPRLTLIKRLHG